jgi:uncharacterized delta-60 repeat protein
MRGSLLVTFDELIDDRGVDSFSISVNGVQRDLHFTDVNNYYSTYVFTGNSVSITIGTNDPTVIPNVSITRLDYTTDAEGIDNGIKETQIYPVYSGSLNQIFSFTAETINSAYNFHYKINISTISKVVYSYSLGYDASTPFLACQDYFTSPTTYYTWKPTLEDGVYIFTSSQFVSQPSNGYYSDGTNVWYKGTGLPLLNESLCATPTPTPTPTPTMTPTPTPTPATCYDIGSGFNTYSRLVKICSDNKSIFSGDFITYNGTSRKGIAKINTDGTLDTSFSIQGSGFNTSSVGARVQSDDKVIVHGNFTNYNGTSVYRLARLNTDGTLDTSFVTGTGFGQYVYTTYIQSDGKILVGGTFNIYNGTVANRIIRLNSDGSIDSSFNIGTGPNNTVFGIDVGTDGKIYLIGDFTFFNGLSYNKIVKLNSDGSVDTSFTVLGTGFNNDITAFSVQTDNKMIIGGEFTNYNGTSANGVIRLNSDGSIDTGFNYGSGFVKYLIGNFLKSKLQSDGKILFGGDFSSYNGTSANRIIRLNSDGSVDTGFNYGTGFFGQPESFEIQSDGKILVAGLFTSYNGLSVNRIIRLNSDGTENICP